MKSESLEKIKSLLLSLLLVTTVLVYLFYQGKLNHALSVFNGYEDQVFYQTGTNQARVHYALGVDPEGNETVTKNGPSGTVRRTLESLGIPAGLRPQDSYMTENGMLLAGGRNVDENQLYLIDFAEEHADLILSVYSHEPYEEMFSTISEDSTGYAFMVQEESGRQVYIYEIINKVLKKGNFYPKDGPQPLMVYPSGTVVLKEGDMIPEEETIWLNYDFGRTEEEAAFPENSRVWSSNGSLWLLDKDKADLWFLGQQKSGLVCSLKDPGFGAFISITSSGAGLSVYTDTKKSILLSDAQDSEEFTDALTDTKSARKSFILLIAASLLATVVIYVLMELYRRRIHSFVLIGMIAAMGVITLTLMVMEQAGVRPWYREMAQETERSRLGYICSQDLQMESYLKKDGGEIHEEEDHKDIHEFLLGESSDTTLMHFFRENGEIYLRKTHDTRTHLSAANYPRSFVRAIEKAMQEGNSYAEFTLYGRKCTAVAIKSNAPGPEWGSVILSDAPELSRNGSLYEIVVSRIIGGALISCCIVIFLLLMILRSRVTSLSRECDSFAEGKNVRVIPDRRDELGALALKIENAIRTKELTEQECGSLRDTYRRLLPAGLLEMFGMEREEQLKPGDTLEKEVFLMRIRFFFTKELGEAVRNESYGEFNRFLSGTLSYIRKSGGYPVRFGTDGVEAVFPAGSQNVVNAAIAIRQDLAAGSKLHLDGNEKVEMFIGAEKTLYRVGLAGDEEQVSLLYFRNPLLEREKIVGDFREMRNSTVMSEDIVKGERNLLKRYLGSIRTGEEVTRFYEIFKGDPYDVRLAKSYSQDLFEEGVRHFEAKEPEQARKCFLRVLERNVHDMAAVCYLRITEEAGPCGKEG